MLNHYDLGLYVGWFEIPRNFIGLPELYGLKCENLITLVIVFVLVLLQFGRFHDRWVPPPRVLLFVSFILFFLYMWPFYLYINMTCGPPLVVS
jgi:hypothetical protein